MTEPTSVHSILLPTPIFKGAARVYVIQSDPLTLVDTGIASQRTFDVLSAGMAELGFKLQDVGRILLTHKHIDHIGNAWRIQRLSGAEIWIHRRELSAVTDVDPEGRRYAAVARERLASWNVPRSEWPPTSVEPKRRWTIESAEANPLDDGQQIQLNDQPLDVLHMPGHTLGCVCFRWGGYLFTGDHVLPNISPNIGAGDIRADGLLELYLDSLARTRELDQTDLEIMPGHGDPFTGLAQRCDRLRDHHLRRLDRVVKILETKGAGTVYAIARRLFGRMREFHLTLGCAEAAAHLQYLQRQGQVTELDGTFHPV